MERALTDRQLILLRAVAEAPRTESELLALSGGQRPARTVASLRRHGLITPTAAPGRYTLTDRGAATLHAAPTAPTPTPAVQAPPADVAPVRSTRPSATKRGGLYDVGDGCLCDFAQGPCWYHDRGRSARALGEGDG